MQLLRYVLLMGKNYLLACLQLWNTQFFRGQIFVWKKAIVYMYIRLWDSHCSKKKMIWQTSFDGQANKSWFLSTVP